MFVSAYVVASHASVPSLSAVADQCATTQDAGASIGAQDPTNQPPPNPTSKTGKKQKRAKPKKSTASTDEPPSPDEDVVDPAPVDTGGKKLFVWKQHPSFRFGSVFRIDFEAQLQEDAPSSYPGSEYRVSGNPTGLRTLDLHRNRIGIKGNLFKHIEYEVKRELTEKELTDRDVTLGITPKSQWKDVNVNLTYLKRAQIQVGKFKIPFGLDELTGVTHNDFVYRSRGASYLAPARDVGAMVHGELLKHGFTYATGVFTHDGDNARSTKIQGGDETFAARVTGSPFRRTTRDAMRAIDVGTAFTISALSDDSFRPNGLRGRTVLTADTFYQPVYVKGHRRRWEADLDWNLGPFSARAEYTKVSDDRRNQGLGDEDLPNARAQAWYLSSTWVVTGEPKRRPLKAREDVLRGGVGAIELAARYERIWFDSAGGDDVPTRNPRAETIQTSAERVFTIGVNWTLNRFVKLQINGIREHLEDPFYSPVLAGDTFWSRVVRLQFVL